MALPKTFTHHNQPYGSITFIIEEIEPCTAKEGDPDWVKYRADNGFLNIGGTVIEGTETNRIFQYTATRDLKGTKHSICVSPHDLDAGSKTTVAM